jgi:hypothetical protein
MSGQEKLANSSQNLMSYYYNYQRPSIYIFLTEELPPLLEAVLLATRQTLWFVNDGASTHLTQHVKQFLDSYNTD